MKELTAEQANKLAMEQQVIKVRVIENALTYSFRGKSMLWGSEVTAATLAKAQNELAELDRLRYQYTRKDKLPYFNSPGSLQEKIKDHFDNDGTMVFVEMIPSSTGKKVKVHLEALGTIKKQIKQKQMATKKKAAKKVAKKAAPAKKKSAGPTLRSVVEGLVGKGKDNAAILEHLKKNKIAHSEKSVRWYASKARAIL